MTAIRNKTDNKSEKKQARVVGREQNEATNKKKKGGKKKQQ